MEESLGAVPAATPVVKIGLPLALWGSGYAGFLPRWWHGVTHLQRQPDEIHIVTDIDNFKDANDSVPEEMRQITKVVVNKKAKSYAEYWNAAILGLNADWSYICNVDDIFLPEALNDCEKAEAAGCNLITDMIKDLSSPAFFKSRWNGIEIGTEWHMVGAEPMRISLFREAGGFPEGQRFADWALAMKMYFVGVKAYDSQIVRIIFDRGLTRKTVSSILNGQDVLQEGYARLTELSKSLGFSQGRID